MGDVQFVRVDSDIVDNLIDKDEAKDSVLSEKEEEKVKSLFKTAVGADKENSLELKGLSPEGHPVLITRPEFMRRMMEMQQLQGGSMPGMMDMHNIVVNTNHPLISEKLLKMRNEEKREKFAAYLYNLARLNQNLLKGEELTSFIEDSIELIK